MVTDRAYRRATSSRLIGRDAELADLADVLRRGLAGQPCLVLLAGETGIGKSRLLDEFLANARAAGAAVMVGACVPMIELHLPYAPVLDALRALLRSGARRHPADLLGPVVTDLVNLADVRDTPPDLFRWFLRAFGRLTEDGPVVLAIEDLHW